MKTSYRGFEITLSSADVWFAEIINPTTGKPWSKRITSSMDEGRATALKRAQNMVDAFIALRGPRAA